MSLSELFALLHLVIAFLITCLAWWLIGRYEAVGIAVLLIGMFVAGMFTLVFFFSHDRDLTLSVVLVWLGGCLADGVLAFFSVLLIEKLGYKN